MTNSTIVDVQPSDTTVSESAFHNLTQRIHRSFVDVLDLSCVGNLRGEELRRNLRLKAEEVYDKVCNWDSKGVRLLLRYVARPLFVPDK